MWIQLEGDNVVGLDVSHMPSYLLSSWSSCFSVHFHVRWGLCSLLRILHVSSTLSELIWSKRRSRIHTDAMSPLLNHFFLSSWQEKQLRTPGMSGLEPLTFLLSLLLLTKSILKCHNNFWHQNPFFRLTKPIIKCHNKNLAPLGEVWPRQRRVW